MLPSSKPRLAVIAGLLPTAPRTFFQDMGSGSLMVKPFIIFTLKLLLAV